MLKLHYNPLRVKRGKTFTEDEKMRLYQCMLPDLDIIDSKSMDSVTVVRKAEAWKRVTLKFNSSPSVFRRTTEQLKKCFENAKCRKQWVKPDPASVAHLVHADGQASTVGALQSMHSALGDILQVSVDAAAYHDNANKYELYDDLQPEIEERLDNIKCELIDMTEAAEDNMAENEDTRHSAVVELESTNQFPDETSSDRTTRDYAEQSSLDRDGTGQPDAGLFPEDIDEVGDTVFVDAAAAAVYRHQVPRLYVAPSRKKLPRRVFGAEADVVAEPLPKDNAVSPGGGANASTRSDRLCRIKDLEEQLLRAQVREAESAATAAEVQLQLNQLAVQHAQAEELRRQQLHALRVRRLSQLTGEPAPRFKSRLIVNRSEPAEEESRFEGEKQGRSRTGSCSSQERGVQSRMYPNFVNSKPSKLKNCIEVNFEDPV